MKEFLISRFDTESEREGFLKLYNLEGYRDWLNTHKYTSTLDNLKTYKNWCYNYVMESIWTL